MSLFFCSQLVDAVTLLVGLETHDSVPSRRLHRSTLPPRKRATDDDRQKPEKTDEWTAVDRTPLALGRIPSLTLVFSGAPKWMYICSVEPHFLLPGLWSSPGQESLETLATPFAVSLPYLHSSWMFFRGSHSLESPSLGCT